MIFLTLQNALIIGTTFFGAAIALRALRAFERRGQDRELVESLQTRISQLESELSQLSSHLQALDAAQDFTSRLLRERGSGKE
jgi:vacuolar-type H+-ATPase subunit I/STV1